MNNQAAQTIPLPPPYSTSTGFALFNSDQMRQYARDYAAALSQTAGEDASHERARLLVPVLKKSAEYWGNHHCASELKRAIGIIEDLLLATAPAASGGDGAFDVLEKIANHPVIRQCETAAAGFLLDSGYRWDGEKWVAPQSPSAASVSERARDDLHVAICQAVALMNMEPMTTPGLLQAHDILRKAIS